MPTSLDQILTRLRNNRNLTPEVLAPSTRTPTVDPTVLADPRVVPGSGYTKGGSDGTLDPIIKRTDDLTFISGLPLEFQGLRRGFSDAMSLFLIDALQGLGPEFQDIIPGIEACIQENKKRIATKKSGEGSGTDDGFADDDDDTRRKAVKKPGSQPLTTGEGVDRYGSDPLLGALAAISTGLSLVNQLRSLTGGDDGGNVTGAISPDDKSGVESLMDIGTGTGAQDLRALLELFRSAPGIAGAGSQPLTTGSSTPPLLTEDILSGAASPQQSPEWQAWLDFWRSQGSGATTMSDLTRLSSQALGNLQEQGAGESLLLNQPGQQVGFGNTAITQLINSLAQERGLFDPPDYTQPRGTLGPNNVQLTPPPSPSPTTGTDTGQQQNIPVTSTGFTPPNTGILPEALAPGTTPTGDDPLGPTTTTRTPPNTDIVPEVLDGGGDGDGDGFGLNSIFGDPNAFQQFVQSFSLPGFSGPFGTTPSPLQRQATDFAGRALNADPFGSQANVEQALNELITTGSRFDLSPEFDALEQVTNRRRDEGLAALQEQFGSNRLGFGSDVGRAQGNFLAEILSQENLQRQQLARESFESATGRRMEALTLPEQLRALQLEGANIGSGIAERDRAADENTINRMMAEWARTQGSLFPLILQFALSGYGGDVVIPEAED